MTWIGFWTATEELSVLAEKFLKYENINFNTGTTSYKLSTSGVVVKKFTVLFLLAEIFS